MKGSKHSLQCHPHDAALVNANSFVSMGAEARVSPLPQHCTSPAHEEATHPSSLLPLPWPSPLQLPLLSLLLLLSPSPLSIAVAIAVGHCRRGCCCPLPPMLPSHCRQPLPLPSPLPSAIAIFVTVSQHSRHLRWPSPLPSLLAIAESCCLGAARIVFKQFKQIMLSLFYFVWTVGGTLIKAG